MVDVVCIGAHPDDVEIGMGATIASMVRDGARVVVIDLTDGEPTPHGTPERRAEEAASAARILGVERITLDLPNRELADTVEARLALAAVLREIRPRAIFAPCAADAHPDHVAAAALAMAGRFYGKLTKAGLAGEPHYAGRFYQYAAIHLATAVTPAFVVPADEDALALKMKALRAYQSQFIDNPANTAVLERVEIQTRCWGTLANAPAGEPFLAVETVVVQSPLALM